MPRHPIPISKVCEKCGKEFIFNYRPDSPGKYCSFACYRTRSTSLIDLFFHRVGQKQTNGCILWTGRKTKAGYGQLGKKRIYAHRFAYELVYAQIPEGMHVLHRCDQPSCINPSHLFLGTHADNMADMTAKGRRAAKLNFQKVAAIRAAISDGEDYESISIRFKIGHSTIRKIMAGKSWKNTQ